MRLSAHQLAGFICSLGSAIRTVHRTVLISAPPLRGTSSQYAPATPPIQTIRLSSQRAIHFVSRACRRFGSCLAVAHWALRFAPFTGRCSSRPLPRLSALRLGPGRCSLGSATRTVARTQNPNDPPQFARGHFLRLSRLSALRLVSGRCSLGSATRTVHRTVRVSAPRNAPQIMV